MDSECHRDIPRARKASPACLGDFVSNDRGKKPLVNTFLSMESCFASDSRVDAPSDLEHNGHGSESANEKMIKSNASEEPKLGPCPGEHTLTPVRI